MFFPDGYSPIHIAFMSASIEVIDLLMNSGANAELKVSTDGRTVLHLAVERGDLKMVSFVVEKALVSMKMI